MANGGESEDEAQALALGLTGTARTTGLLYLGLAVTGALGFLLVCGQLFVADDPGGTSERLAGAR